MTWTNMLKREVDWYSDGNTFIEGLTIGRALALLREKAEEVEHSSELSAPYDEAIRMLLEVIKVLEGTGDSDNTFMGEKGDR